MNKKLPFEEAFEQQMKNLQSPNEDGSWQKMKDLLDNDRKEKPFAFFRLYKSWGALLLLLLIGAWLINSSKSPDEKPVASSENNNAFTRRTPEKPIADASKKSKLVKNGARDTLTDPTKSNIADPARAVPEVAPEETRLQQNTKTVGLKEPTILPRKNSPSKNRSIEKSFQVSKQIIVMKANDNEIKSDKLPQGTLPRSSSETIASPQTKESYDTGTVNSVAAKESSTGKNKDTLNKAATSDSLHIIEKKQNIRRPKKFIVNAGLGVQQQIPTAGQRIVQIGHKGNNSALSDYIPSLYFRLEREQKWFLQGEFIYRSPQSVKEFAFSRRTVADTLNSVTTTVRLRKTFYTEIPVSFNYYVSPKFSVGIGGTYSWLYGAIAEKETSTKNMQNQPISVVKQIVPIKGYTDSFLYRSHTYLMVQSDYQWRRLSLGVRYSRDLQPYIKYTLPNGTVTDEKNWSLEFILRLRVWKSPRF